MSINGKNYNNSASAEPMVRQRREVSTSTTTSTNTTRLHANTSINKKKKYSSNKSQLRKSIGFQLDFNSLMPRNDNNPSDELLQKRNRKEPRKHSLNLNKSASVSVSPKTESTQRSSSLKQSLELPINSQSDTITSVNARKGTSKEDQQGKVRINSLSNTISPSDSKLDSVDTDDISSVNTVNQGTTMPDSETPIQFTTENDKVALILRNTNPEILQETKKLSYLILNMRKSLMADFADPSYSSLDPIKTYNIKALNEQYNDKMRRLNEHQQKYNDMQPIENQHEIPTELSQQEGAFDTYDKKPLVCSRATLIRAQRTKAALTSYYMYLEKFQQPFKIHPLNQNFMDDDFDHDMLVEETLGWNPLQIIRNRKAMKKYEDTSIHLETKPYSLHPMASTAFSKNSKKKFLWEIDTDEFSNNFYWSVRNWYWLKNSKNQLIFYDHIKTQDDNRQDNHHHHHHLRRRGSGSSSAHFYKNANHSSNPFLESFTKNHFNRSSVSGRKSEKLNNGSDPSFEPLTYGTNLSGGPSHHFPLPMPLINAKSILPHRGSLSNSSSISHEGDNVLGFHAGDFSDMPDDINRGDVSFLNGNDIKEPTIMVNDEEAPYLKESSKLDNVSSKLRKLSQNKSFVKNKFINKMNKSRETAITSSDSSNARSRDSLYHNYLSLEDLPLNALVFPRSESSLLPLSENRNKSTNILGTVLIEPLSKRGVMTQSSEPLPEFAHAEDKELLAGDNDNENNSIVAVPKIDYLSPDQAFEALNNENKIKKTNSGTSRSSQSSRKSDVKHNMLNDFKFINANLHLIDNHLSAQKQKYDRLFELDKEYTITTTSPHCNNVSSFKEQYDKVIKGVEWISTLLPIYLKSLTREVERLNGIKSEIHNDHSDKIDMLLSTSDRLISIINTRLSINLKNINDKLSHTNSTLMIINKNEFALNKAAFTLIEYSIIGLLYFIWCVISFFKVIFKIVAITWKIIKWIFW